MELLRTSYEVRPPELIRQHYEIEKALAARLRSATREERRLLYSEVYNELFRRVPHHPQIARKSDEHSSALEASRKMKLVGRHLNPDTILLEIGPGDCRFAFEAARRVSKVYGVDVSSEIAKNEQPPVNFELILSDGCTVPVAAGSANVAYSNQLMEHLHPDDAKNQLQNLYKAIAPGGIYICITPNRLSGPHDVSQHFDDVATGFHLKEYSYSDLTTLFREAGFTRFMAYIGGKGLYLRFPLPLLIAFEHMLGWLPKGVRRRIARSAPGRAMLGANLVARKPK